MSGDMIEMLNGIDDALQYVQHHYAMGKEGLDVLFRARLVVMMCSVNTLIDINEVAHGRKQTLKRGFDDE